VLSTLGSHKAVQLSGVQNLVLDGSSSASGSTPIVIFFVMELDESGAATDCFEQLLTLGTAQTGEAKITGKGCPATLTYAEAHSITLIHPRYTLPQGKPALVTAEITESAVSVWMNGSFDFSWSNSQGVVDSMPQSATLISGAPWLGVLNGWVGRIGEIVILSGNSSTENARGVDQYLLRKWDIPAW
jgi:hypothetical protein